MRPKVMAGAIIERGGQRVACFSPGPQQFLVQVDQHEARVRLPSAEVAPGETAAQAIERELGRAYDLEATVGPLVAVCEEIAPGDGAQQHQVTLLHRCDLADLHDLPDTLPHNDQPKVRLVWRTLAQLAERPLHPEGALALLQQESPHIAHLVAKKSYDGKGETYE